MADRGRLDRADAARTREADGGAREAFLARVAAELRLPSDLERNILDELRDHLVDTEAGLRDEGLDVERAEREALARLGSPIELAGRFRSAHQTRRRAMAAVGGGIWTATSEGFYALVLGIMVLIVAEILASAALAAASLVASWTTSRAAEFFSSTAAPITLAWVFAAERGARAATLIVAARSRRRVRSVAKPVAVAGGAFLAWMAVAVVSFSLDWPTVICTAAIPVAFAFGALRVREGEAWRWRPRRTWRPLAGLAVALAIGGFAVGATAPSTVRPWEIDSAKRDQIYRFDRIGPAAPIADSSWIAGSSSQWSTASPVFASWSIDSSVPAPWRDLRIEIWRAESPDGPIAADAARPVAVQPVQVVEGVIEASVVAPRYRDLTAWWFVLTGVDAAGIRQRLSDPTSIYPTPFRGTLIDWFTSGGSPDR